MVSRPAPRRSRRFPLATTIAIAIAVLVGACGGDDGGSAEESDGSDATSLDLGGDASRGEELAEDNGCQSCHRPGGGGIGPDWEGLYGSDVVLDDGTTVVADDAYLTRAITDPEAQKVEGYSIAMPENSLSSSDVASIVAYLHELGSATSPGGTEP